MVSELGQFRTRELAQIYACNIYLGILAGCWEDIVTMMKIVALPCQYLQGFYVSYRTRITNP